jgi:maltose alpha-D-glucosyltransferase / alpha-amylase
MCYKRAVVYCLAVETFLDGNDDGYGDFAGLTAALDYFEWLGVDCLWLEPFYASPLRDNGYDVADHCAVHPRMGTLADFDAFIERADRHGIAVLVDLVVNHTSDEHPWFRSARSDPRSAYRDYYLWTDDPQAHPEPDAFPTVEKSPWSYDEAAESWYLHRF